jgi:hypothetical protein
MAYYSLGIREVRAMLGAGCGMDFVFCFGGLGWSPLWAGDMLLWYFMTKYISIVILNYLYNKNMS